MAHHTAPRSFAARRLAPLARLAIGCGTAAAALGLAAQPASAQSVTLGLDVGTPLAALLGALDAATNTPSGGVAPGVDVRVDGLDAAVSSLIGPSGVVADIGHELNRQGTLLDVQAGDLASLRVGLNDLRGVVSAGPDLTGLRATVTQHEALIGDHDARLDAHDGDLAELRAKTTVHEGEHATMKTGMEAHAEMLENHDATLTAHGSSLAALQSRVAVGESALAGLSEARVGLADLDRRVRSGYAELSGRIDAVDRRVDTANEGVAMALALKTPAVADDKTFALSGGWGTFEGENAFAVSGAVRASQAIQIDAGLAVGAGQGSLGGRAGATVSW